MGRVRRVPGRRRLSPRRSAAASCAGRSSRRGRVRAGAAAAVAGRLQLHLLRAAGGLHGLNPYDFAPAAIPDDLAASRVQDYRDATSVYGPLFTLVTYPLGLVGVPAALWGLKALAALSVLGIAALVARLAAVRGVAPAPAAAFVALNPLVLVHVVGGAHNDGLMMLALLAGVALVLGAGEARGGRVHGGRRRGQGSGGGRGAVRAPRRRRRRGGGLGCWPGPRRGRRDRRVALAAFGSSALRRVSAITGSQQRVSYHSVPATVARIAGVDVDLVARRAGGAYGAGGRLAPRLDRARRRLGARHGLGHARLAVRDGLSDSLVPDLGAAARRGGARPRPGALTLGLSAYQLSVGVPG